MARSQGSIIAKGEGRWRIRWCRGMKPYEGDDTKKKGTLVRDYGSETIHGTKRTAAKALREKLGRQDRGLAAPSRSAIPVLRDQIEAWKGSQGAAALRASTCRDYEWLLARHVIPALGALRIDAIRVSTIEREVVRPLVERGRHRTAQLTVAALSGVFRDALKDEALGLVANPCRGVAIPRKPRAQVVPLSNDERPAFREAVRGTPHECLWVLMMLTGLGPNEALALDWQAIDFEAGTLAVKRTLDTRVGVLVEDTKRASRKRKVPIVPELRAMLRERWLAAGRPAEGLVFVDPLGRPLDLDNLRKHHFQPAVKRAGIQRRVRIYDLRHGYATAALEAGVDVKTVSELMGHSSPTMVLTVYAHVSDERKREAAKRIGALLGG